jgi:hypothetical protein
MGTWHDSQRIGSPKLFAMFVDSEQSPGQREWCDRLDGAQLYLKGKQTICAIIFLPFYPYFTDVRAIPRLVTPFARLELHVSGCRNLP